MTATGLSALTLADLSTRYKEPRIRDVRIGERLGMAQPLNIRQLVETNRTELEGYGRVFTRRVKTSAKGGRPGTEYWLNEPQTLLLCMLSRTERAAAVRREVISVYMDYRRGKAEQTAIKGLPTGNGRYLVVVQDHCAIETVSLTNHCLVNGRDPMSVTTFLREFIRPDVLPAALGIILQRVCARAGNGNRREHEALMSSMARISADLAATSSLSRH